MDFTPPTEDTPNSEVVKTHEIAPVVNNEVTVAQDANNAASPTKGERLGHWYKTKLQPYAPRKQTLRWISLAMGVCLVVFIIGISIGMTSRRMSQSETYNLRVSDRGNDYFEKIKIFDEVAMLYTPKHKGIVRSTTIHDFKTGWTGIHDEEHDICFVRPLNRTNFPSLQQLKEVVSAKRRVPEFTPAVDKAWESQIITHKRIDHLSFMLHWKCTGRGLRTFLLVPTNATAQFSHTAGSCTSVCLPHYGLSKVASKEGLHFDMPTVDCFKHAVC